MRSRTFTFPLTLTPYPTCLWIKVYCICWTFNSHTTGLRSGAATTLEDEHRVLFSPPTISRQWILYLLPNEEVDFAFCLNCFITKNKYLFTSAVVVEICSTTYSLKILSLLCFCFYGFVLVFFFVCLLHFNFMVMLLIFNNPTHTASLFNVT